jgi:hypothetical protein
VAEETALTGEADANLVKPPGTLHGKLIVRLNYPTTQGGIGFFTPYSIMTDQSNISINLALRKLRIPLTDSLLLKPEDVFFLNLFFRRCHIVGRKDRPSDPYLKDFREKATLLHQELADKLWDLSSAPLGVLFGHINFLQYERTYPNALFLPLRPRSYILTGYPNALDSVASDSKRVVLESGVFIEYDEEKNKKIGNRKQIKRLSFILPHPEMFARMAMSTVNIDPVARNPLPVELAPNYQTERLLDVALAISG